MGMRKVFAAVLAVALLGGALAGCSGQASSVQSGGPGSGASFEEMSSVAASSAPSSSSSVVSSSQSASEQSGREETPTVPPPNIPYPFGKAPPVQVCKKALAFEGLKSFGGTVQNNKELFYVVEDTIENDYWDCSGEPGTLYYSDMGEVYKVMDGVFAIAGAGAGGLYLVKWDEGVKQLSSSEGAHEHRASLVYYNPVAQSSKTLVKGVENAILTGVNNEIVLYTRFVPYQSEQGDVRMEIVKYEIASGEETIVFQDDFEEWYETMAQSSWIYERDEYIYINFLYSYPSDGPLSRPIKLTKYGSIISNGQMGGGYRSYSTLPTYAECGNFVVKTQWKNSGQCLWALKNGEEELLTRSLGAYSISQTGLLYYAHDSTINDRHAVAIDVYNGVEATRFTFGTDEYSVLHYSSVVGNNSRIYLGAVTADGTNYDADSCFVLYEATGTVDDPLAMEPILRVEWPGSENDYYLRDINPYQHGSFTIFARLDGSYILLNTLTGQCLAYNMQGMEILQ